MPFSEASQIQTTGPYPVMVKYRRRDWDNTTGYSSVAKYDLPVNNYGDRTRYGQQSASWVHRVNSSGSEWSTPTWSTGNSDAIRDFALNEYLELDALPSVWSVSSANNEAHIKCLKSVSDAKINIGVALAEARKTSDLILSAARRVDRAFRAFRRGNLREVARVLDIVPGRVHKTWLEYKYGWMPVLMDVKGAAEFFAQQHCSRPIRFVSTGKASYRKQRTENKTYTLWVNNSVNPYTETCILEYSVKIKAWCEISNPHLSALQQLGLTNPALVAWELIPFSFVFDWFISVGSWLEALTACHGVEVKKAMKSYVATGSATQRIPAYFGVDGTGTVRVDQYTKEGTIREYWRAPFSITSSSVYPPVATKQFGFEKLLTSLALLRAQRR